MVRTPSSVSWGSRSWAALDQDEHPPSRMLLCVNEALTQSVISTKKEKSQLFQEGIKVNKDPNGLHGDQTLWFDGDEQLLQELVCGPIPPFSSI